jgi:Domain of unknown function (DUF4190)/Domain of unknown function (DUF1707)
VTSDPGPGSNGFPLPPSYGPPSYGAAPYGPSSPAPYGQPPYGPYPYGQQARYVQPGMLAAAADRERTIDVLKAAYGEGRLTKEEFDARSARVLAARTYADLSAIVADLPIGPSGPVVPYHVGYYPPVVPASPTNGLAIASMICGIAEIPTLGMAAIPAVILGHLARGQIKQTGERGDGMAVAGLVLGYLAIAGWLLIFLAIASHN